MHNRIACFGGVYSNYLALEAAIADARRRDVDALYCLGDIGAFGPYPDRSVEILRENNIVCVQGNYDNSLAAGLDDCQCGYTDPSDNRFARLSYQYTFQNTAKDHREWMGTLPRQLRVQLGPVRVLLCHGSPRRTNEFLWESTTSTHFLDKLATDHDADMILATHTGIHWLRDLSNGRRFVNVGVLGRPENDGHTNVWYTVLTVSSPSPPRTAEPPKGAGDPLDAGSPLGAEIQIEFVPVVYDHQRLVRDMIDQRAPEEFVETIRTGWWTTCLEILPSKERRVGRF